MPTRLHLLALAVGAAFIALGVWQMATAPAPPAPSPPPPADGAAAG